MDLSKNNPDLVAAYEGYAADYFAKYGRQPTITSAARTDEKQAELYARWQAGDKGVFMPAKPRGDGSIRHQYALDLRQADIDESLLQKNGLWRPFGAKDPVHIELAGNRNGKAIGAPMTTAAIPTSASGTAGTNSVGTMAGMGGNIESTLGNILALLTQGQGAARAEGQAQGQGAYEAGVTAQAQANRQAEYLGMAGLNTPSDPSFLRTIMQQTQQQMLQKTALVQERDQWLTQLGPAAGVIEILGGKGASTFMFDPQIAVVEQSLKESQAAMQQYLANTSTVAAMGQKTIASISMAEAVAKQRALEAQAEQNAIQMGLKGQQVILGAQERQEQRDISQQRVDKMGMSKLTKQEEDTVMAAWGLPGDYVKMSGNLAQAKTVSDSLKRNPSAANPNNLDPKLQSASDALVMYSQMGRNVPNEVLRNTFSAAFETGPDNVPGYAVGALTAGKMQFAANKAANKKYQGLSAAQESELIGAHMRMEADKQREGIDPRDPANMYRADWNAMSTVKGTKIFSGPIGKQVATDVGKLTANEARRTYNDKIVLERATQLVKAGVITIDQASEELASMFDSAVKFNNLTKKYEAIGLLPQVGYNSTISGSAIGPGTATIRAFSNAAFGGNQQIAGTEIRETDPRAPNTSVPLNDPSIVRRILLGELIQDRVATMALAPKPTGPQFNSMVGTQGATGADPLTTNTPPEQP